jgi:hypothetical protein
MKAGFAGGKYPYGWHAPGPGDWINTTQLHSIHEYLHYYSSCKEDEFLRAMGQQASEYYLWKHGKTDYIGCTTYRRYLKLDDDIHPLVSKIGMAPTQQHADYFSSDVMRDKALTLLQDHDIITNRLTVLSCSIVDQYKQSQPSEYIDLFLKGINELMPDYRSKMDWWQKNEASFETCYIMRKQLFKKYVSELFELLEYVWQNTNKVYPQTATTSEPLPWRYPGFLGERFLPFFIHANDAKAFRVPLVILE